MNSEDDFFVNLRANLSISDDRDRRLANFPDMLQSDFTEAEEHDKNTLLDVLEESCRRHNLSLYLVNDEQEAAKKIQQLVVEEIPEFSDEKVVVAHDHPLLQELALEKWFAEEKIQFSFCKEGDPDAREKHQISSIGITAPECVVASHGTVVQQSGVGQPRSTSLLPSHHIAVARQGQLVANLEQGFKRMQAMGPNTVFISGPSKTADIEAQLVFGAHGPRGMSLILIRD